MQLYQPTKALFAQLIAVLDEFTLNDYTTPSRCLSGATIGQHTRHIIELFVELNKGYKNGTVDYEKRERNPALETNNSVAVDAFKQILASFIKPDKKLLLVSNTGIENSEPFAISTTYFRELLYNIEHTVHHMALIRVGVQELTNMVLPASFGVASSTLKHRKKLCAR